MSLILDALKRKRGERDADRGHPDTAQGDSVLSTLGYRRRARNGPPLATLLMFGGAALAVGFAGLSLLVFLLVPSSPSSSSATSATSRTVADPPVIAPIQPSAPPPVMDQAATLPSTPSAAAVPRLVATLPAPTRAELPPTRPLSEPAGTGPPAGSSVQEPLAVPAPLAARPPQDHFALALYYQRVGDFDSARAQYRTLLEQNDGSAEVHNNLGLLYQGQEQFDDAIQQFRRAIAVNPKYGKAHNNLGVALMQSGQLEAAGAEFRAALATDPRSVASMVNLALVHRAGGRVGEARDLLLRAVVVDPRNAGSHYNLAAVADQAGDTAIAIEHYRAFLRLGTVGQADLPARVRARLTVLGG